MTTTVDTHKSLANQEPDIMLSVREVFGIDTDLEVPAFSKVDDHVPDIDEAYLCVRYLYSLSRNHY